MSDPQTGGITKADKQTLYGEYMAGNKRKQDLFLKVAHKHFDIPDDDMDMHLDKSVRGIGTGGAIGIAAAVGLPALAAIGVLAYAMLNAQPQPSEGTDKYRVMVKLYDKDGNLISEVPHISQMKE